MSKVYIINDSGHDYSQAKEKGDLVYLTKGRVASYDTNKNFRNIIDSLKNVTEDDYILVTSLASLNIIVGWIIGYKRIPLNLLIFKDNKYLERRLVPTLIEGGEE